MIELFKHITPTNGGYFHIGNLFYKSKISYSGNREIIVAAIPGDNNVIEAFGDEINELIPINKDDLMCVYHSHPEELIVVRELTMKSFRNKNEYLEKTRAYRLLYDNLLVDMFKTTTTMLEAYENGMGKAIQELYITKNRKVNSDEINSLILGSGFAPYASRIIKSVLINSFMSSGKIAIQLSKNAYLRKEEKVNPYLSLTFATWSLDYDKWLDDRTATLITGIDKQTAEAIKLIIDKSVYEMMPIDKAASEIRKLVGLNKQQAAWVISYRELLQREAEKGNIRASKIGGMINTYINKLHRLRAMTIARTETISALNFGALQGYKQSYVKRVIWVCAPGACPQCLPYDMQVFDIDDLPYPDAWVHPNCRCTVAPDATSIEYDIDII